MKLLTITLSLILYSTFLTQSVEARRLRDTTLRQMSNQVCQYAEAYPDIPSEKLSLGVIKYAQENGADIDDVQLLLSLLERDCPLDAVQYMMSSLSSNRVQEIMINLSIKDLCREAQNTSIQEAQAFQTSVSNVRDSLDISMAEIPNFNNKLEQNCESAERLLARAEQQNKDEKTSKLEQYGYEEGMTYGEFREVLIKRGWQPINQKSSTGKYSEVSCGSAFCTASFISNKNRLSVNLKVRRNKGRSKKIPTNLKITPK